MEAAAQEAEKFREVEAAAAEEEAEGRLRVVEAAAQEAERLGGC